MSRTKRIWAWMESHSTSKKDRGSSAENTMCFGLGPFHGYDPSSGQVFTETTAKMADSISDGGLMWKHETPTLGSKINEPVLERHRVGAKTLHQLSMERTFKDQRELADDALVELPWYTCKSMWEFLKYYDATTLFAWRSFMTAHPEEFSELARRNRSRILPALVAPLSEYVKQMWNSDSISWITVLGLSHDGITNEDLVSLGNLKNLGLLDLGMKDREMDIRVIRAWAEAGAFQHLKVLIIRPRGITHDQLLPYLNHFPSLRVVAISQPPLLLSGGDLREKRNIQKLLRQSTQIEDDIGWKIMAATSYEQYVPVITHKRLFNSPSVLHRPFPPRPPYSNQYYAFRHSEQDLVEYWHTVTQKMPEVFGLGPKTGPEPPIPNPRLLIYRTLYHGRPLPKNAVDTSKDYLIWYERVRVDDPEPLPSLASLGGDDDFLESGAGAAAAAGSSSKKAKKNKPRLKEGLQSSSHDLMSTLLGL